MTNILLVLLVDGFKFALPPYVGWWSAMTNVCFRGETTIIPNQNTIGDIVNSHDWYKWRMSPTNMIGEYNSWIQSTENIRRYVEHINLSNERYLDVSENGEYPKHVTWIGTWTRKWWYCKSWVCGVLYFQSSSYVESVLRMLKPCKSFLLRCPDFQKHLFLELLVLSIAQLSSLQKRTHDIRGIPASGTLKNAPVYPMLDRILTSVLGQPLPGQWNCKPRGIPVESSGGGFLWDFRDFVMIVMGIGDFDHLSWGFLPLRLILFLECYGI